MAIYTLQRLNEAGMMSTHLVPLSYLANNILLGQSHVIKRQLTSRGCFDTELAIRQGEESFNTHLLLLLGDLDTLIFAHDKAGDPFIPF